MLVQPFTELCQRLTTVFTIYDQCNIYLVFFVFQVSDGSVVQFEDEHLSLSCEVHKEKLPHGNEHLMSWAKHRYRAITSFTELKMTQDIYIKVGEGVFEYVYKCPCGCLRRLISLVMKVHIFPAHDMPH